MWEIPIYLKKLPSKTQPIYDEGEGLA
jgi:hypothetical protein